MLRPSLLAASAAILCSLSGLVHAVPQGGNGGGGQSGGNGAGAGSADTTTATSATSTAILAVSSTVATASSVAIAAVESEAAAPTSSTACNNSPDLCNRNYNNITYMGAHDSAFLRDSSTDFSVSGNQFYNATTALSSGIRMLQAQVHLSDSTLELCHTTCSLLDGGSLLTFLTAVKGWMDDNPSEVITLILVNSDDQSAATFASVFSSSGIDTYAYTPDSTTAPITTWPTLQTMIDADTRLVVFIASVTYDSDYPYLLSEFDYVFETAYDLLGLNSFNCTLDRPSTLVDAGSTAAVSAGYLSMLNHFAETSETFFSVPDVTDIATTNSPSTTVTGAAGTHGLLCATEWGLKPTFILVDFWNVGPSIDTGDELNGITATGRTTTSDAILTASSSSGAGSVVRTEGLASWGKMAVAMGMVAMGNFVWL